MDEVKLYSIVYEGCGTAKGESICIAFFKTYESAYNALKQMHENLSIPDNQVYDMHKCDTMIRVIAKDCDTKLGEDDNNSKSQYISTNSSDKSYGYIEGLSIIQVLF